MQTGKNLIPSDDINLDDLVVLECSTCNADVVVSTDTRPFHEVGTGQRLAYYMVGPDGHEKLGGVSDGRAETFSCIDCHAREWAARNSYAS